MTDSLYCATEKESLLHCQYPTSHASNNSRSFNMQGSWCLQVFWGMWWHSFFIDYLQNMITMNGEYYVNLLRQLLESIKTKRTGKLMKVDLFHQNNAPAHKFLVSMASERDCSFELIHPPLYSSDLTILNFTTWRFSWEPISQCWWRHIFFWLFWPTG